MVNRSFRGHVTNSEYRISDKPNRRNNVTGIELIASNHKPDINTMKSLVQVVLLSAIVMVAACDSADTEPENTPLSERETEELLTALLVVVSDTMPQITATHSPEEFTIACPEEGEMRLSVNVTDAMPNDSTSRLSIGVDFTPNGCGIKGDEGTEFTLDAEQSINYLSVLTIQGFFSDVELEGGLDGQLDWMVESRSGTCTIDLDAELEVSTDLSNARSLLAGSACGHELALVDTSSFLQSGPESEQIRRKPVRPRF